MAKARTPRTPKPKAEKTEKKVLQMPDTAASTGSNGNSGSSSRHSSIELESEIRRRAYELYADRGYTDGLHEQDWLEAEREVRSRNPQKHTA